MWCVSIFVTVREPGRDRIYTMQTTQTTNRMQTTQTTNRMESERISCEAHIVRPDYVGDQLIPEWPDYIEIKDQEQIQGLARACQLARHVLVLAGRSLKVGMTTEEIDFIVHQETIKQSIPLPPQVGGFPKSVCTSVNNVVCHGIPDR
ncbi:methionine aminopeptidase 1D, mitochondrial-like [Etheostoma spectabile]|uniref:methionine aminopeptidase 1D, mitochondrial-like n=1 Tax=Etheostoma spectabile TaxID=54343 RepID=UPI0013AF1199|nr:methionine aminopeptidase 1D, mitochondrial-like [Etheostoma spectabile]